MQFSFTVIKDVWGLPQIAALFEIMLIKAEGKYGLCREKACGSLN